MTTPVMIDSSGTILYVNTGTLDPIAISTGASIILIADSEAAKIGTLGNGHYSIANGLVVFVAQVPDPPPPNPPNFPHLIAAIAASTGIDAATRLAMIAALRGN